MESTVQACSFILPPKTLSIRLTHFTSTPPPPLISSNYITSNPELNGNYAKHYAPPPPARILMKVNKTLNGSHFDNRLRFAWYCKENDNENVAY
jgi:hypothetical protein